MGHMVRAKREESIKNVLNFLRGHNLVKPWLAVVCASRTNSLLFVMCNLLSDGDKPDYTGEGQSFRRKVKDEGQLQGPVHNVSVPCLSVSLVFTTCTINFNHSFLYGPHQSFLWLKGLCRRSLIYR
jgi:hypothetical protein